MSSTNGHRPSILVVGSINMDLVARCPHIPMPGETVLGSDFTRHPGGKGANAATAAARLTGTETDGRVVILGAIGRDDNGAAARDNLDARGVEITALREVSEAPTGVALIAVADDGDNSIVVAPGANSCLQPRDVEQALPALVPRLVLMQLEIPLETVFRAAEMGRRAGATVLLVPAPAPPMLPDDLLTTVDIVIPNRGELAALTGMSTDTHEEVIQAAGALRARGARTVVVTRGADGAVIVDEGGAATVPAPRVDVVDTTGAGDCFGGALAVALVEDRPLDEAVRFATHAAALACTRLGAQEAQPTRPEVDQALVASSQVVTWTTGA